MEKKKTNKEEPKEESPKVSTEEPKKEQKEKPKKDEKPEEKNDDINFAVRALDGALDDDEKIDQVFRISRKKLLVEQLLKTILPCFAILAFALLIILVPGEKLTTAELVVCIVAPSLLVIFALLFLLFSNAFGKNTILVLTNQSLIVRGGVFGEKLEKHKFGDIEKVCLDNPSHPSYIRVILKQDGERTLTYLSDPAAVCEKIQNVIKTQK